VVNLRQISSTGKRYLISVQCDIFGTISLAAVIT